MNVLVVDDSEIVRAVLTKTLRVSGMPLEEVLEAGNGREALEILENAEVDLVFADINMPEMNGLEMIGEMYRRGLLRKTTVVVVSTEGSRQRVEMLERLGIAGFVRKPFQPEQIRDAVAEFKERPHAA